MIIAKEKGKQVVQSHDFDSVNCTIDAEDMRYVASLLRNNYSNTRLAVVREISANALDANMEAGSTRPIEVKVPTTLNPTFSVRDFGGGLSQEDVFGLYSKYGKSTKRESNNYIGAFGIGKFAPLSYGENFTCVSYNGGLKTSYNIFVNDDDDTKIVKLHEEPSSEPSGLCIEVAVADEDRSEFTDVVQKFFRFFSDEEMPKFLGVEEDFIEPVNKVLEGDSDEWFLLDGDQYHYSYNRATILMGRVAYPLDRESINISSLIDPNAKDRHELERSIENVLSCANLYLRIPLGAVKLHHSRESLEYNKATQQVIFDHVIKLLSEVKEIAVKKLADSEDLWSAKQNYAKIINSMPYGIRNLFTDSFEWNGVKISSSSFDRDWELQDELIITHYYKEDNSDARNGFRVRSQKVNRAICQDKYVFMMQDLESSHGNNLRVRTLMIDRYGLEGVYVIHPKTATAKAQVWDEWEFGRISNEKVFYTSKVEKQKPNRTGVRKSNGTKCNIPLFSLKNEGVHYRLADHWEDVKTDISNLNVSEVEGSVNGKLIYLPIKNYKPTSAQGWDLENVYSKVKKINDLRTQNDKKNFILFGVRVGDVKKLDKENWVDFEEFYFDFCKDVLLKNLDEANKVHTHKTLSVKFGENESYRSLSYAMNTLFRNKTFKPTNAFLNSFREDWEIVHGDISSFILSFYNALSLEHGDWIKENLNVSISWEDFSEKVDILMTKYPLLINIGSHASTWLEFEEENYMKNINEYISLCDGGRDS